MSALPSLTAAQAAERSRLLSVERYDLDVDVVGRGPGPSSVRTSLVSSA